MPLFRRAPRRATSATSPTGVRGLPSRSPIYTIGHGDQPIAQIVRLLRHHRIGHVVDVRVRPYSAVAPHFDRELLAAQLPSAGIGYTWAGETLGGRPADPTCYDAEGHVRYDRVAELPDFQRAVRALVAQAEGAPLAVLGTAEEPMHCVRRVLVGRVLRRQGRPVVHLRAGGRVESEADVERRERIADDAQFALFAAPTAPVWRSAAPVAREG